MSSAKAGIKEAELASKYGYHLGLLSNGGLSGYSEAELIKRAEAVAEIIPVFGFYLQPAAGGRLLSYEFWRALADIPNVYAIKVAAFNRYQTLDVVRAVCNSPRRNEIALYTGNDDNIIADLLTTYRLPVNGNTIEKVCWWFARALGGVDKACDGILNEIKNCIANNYAGAEKLLSKGVEVTDMNAVIFDAKNAFKGCIPGIHEVLEEQVYSKEDGASMSMKNFHRDRWKRLTEYTALILI